MISYIHNDFHLCLTPEHLLERGSVTEPQTATNPDKVVIFGAMSRTVPHPKELRWDTVDLTIKGKNASSIGMAQLMDN